MSRATSEPPARKRLCLTPTMGREPTEVEAPAAMSLQLATPSPLDMLKIRAFYDDESHLGVEELRRNIEEAHECVAYMQNMLRLWERQLASLVEPWDPAGAVMETPARMSTHSHSHLQ
jgi:hypothetical protein